MLRTRNSQRNDSWAHSPYHFEFESKFKRSLSFVCLRAFEGLQFDRNVPLYSLQNGRKHWDI